MNAKEIVGGIFVAIMAYLLIKNPNGTSQVIKAGGGGLTDTIKALQGR